MQPWLAWYSLCRQHRSQHKASFMLQPPESYGAWLGFSFTTACLTLGYFFFLCSSLEQITTGLVLLFTGHEALSKMVKMFYTLGRSSYRFADTCQIHSAAAYNSLLFLKAGSTMLSRLILSFSGSRYPTAQFCKWVQFRGTHHHPELNELRLTEHSRETLSSREAMLLKSLSMEATHGETHKNKARWTDEWIGDVGW